MHLYDQSSKLRVLQDCRGLRWSHSGARLVRPIRHSITPNIIVKSVDEAVSFYKRAFGAEEILRLSTPDGKVVHCELKFGDSRVNLGESMEGWPEHTLLVQIFVADSDAVFAQAVKAGAEVLSPMTDMFLAHGKGASSIHSAAHGQFRRTRRTFRSRRCSAVSMHSLPDAQGQALRSTAWLTTTRNAPHQWNLPRFRIVSSSSGTVGLEHGCGLDKSSTLAHRSR